MWVLLAYLLDELYQVVNLWMNSIKLSICHASVAGKNDHQWSSVYCVRYVLVPCRYLVAKYLPMLIYNASVKLKFCLKEP